MKPLAHLATLLLAGVAAAPAGAIEVITDRVAMERAAAAARLPDLAPAPRAVLLPAAQSTPLPEPEVFAMMLLGVALIGWRASRDSTETFR